MGKTVRAVIIENNKLLVFFRRRIRNGEEVTYYAIPGGHVEENETLEETVIRELKEEMNLDIELLGFLGIIDLDNQEDYYYHAKIIGGELKLSGEELERCSNSNYYEIRWLDLKDLDDSDIRALDLVKKAIRCDYGN